MNLLPVDFSSILPLLHLAKSTFIQTYAHLNDPVDFQRYLDKNFTLEVIQKEWEHPNSTFYFVEKQEEIFGYMKLNWGDAQTEKELPNALEIERIYVKQAVQGQGIGQFMIKKSIEIGQQKNLAWLWLGVWNENPKAIGFYEKMGFITFGEHVFQLGDDPQTDILMKIPLEK